MKLGQDIDESWELFAADLVKEGLPPKVLSRVRLIYFSGVLSGAAFFMLDRCENPAHQKTMDAINDAAERVCKETVL